MIAIQTTGLTKRYGAKTAVDGLELAVRQGEVFALLGGNGAGKTTTVRMLSCLVRPTAGDALVCGHSIVSEPAAVKAVTNVSPQETAVAPKLTVRENLRLIAGVYSCADARATADRAIGEYGLAEVADSYAATLSGGWKRRLSIAMALITRPQVLFLDEPTLGLDVLARRGLWDIIHRLRGNTTVVLTTHYLEEAAALSDRLAVMAQGRLRAVGTVGELTVQTGTATLEDAFVKLSGVTV